MSLDHLAPWEYFGHLPAEFSGEWLNSRVHNLSWPPSLRPDSWRKVLGDMPERWRLYQWRETEIDLNTVAWCSETTETIAGLGDACFRGARNQWTHIVPGSTEKINRLQTYALANGQLPSHLLVTETSQGLFIVDGYHRVTWFKWISSTLAGVSVISPLARCYLGRFEA